MGKRSKLLKPHLKSIEANATYEESEAILRGRLKADEDLRQMEVWASNGNTSGQSLDNPDELI